MPARVATWLLPASLAFFACCFGVAVWLRQPLLLFLPALPLLLIWLIRNLFAAWLLLLATLSFSTEVMLGGGLGTDLPDEPLMALLSLAALAVFIPGGNGHARHLLRNPVFLIIALQFFWFLVTAVFSTHPLFSFKYLLAKTWYIIPFAILPCFFLTDKNRFRLMAWSIAAPLVPVVLIIVFRHGRQGFLFDEINAAVTPFFRNHVNYSAFLACVLPVIWLARRRMNRGRFKTVLTVIIIIFLAALFFSFSRGAWLALAAGVAAGWLLKRKLLAWALAGGLLLLLAGVCWFARDNRYLNYHHEYKKTIYHANFADHMTATFRNTDMSNAERVYRWIAGIRMAGEYPLTGFGPNSFYHNYKSYTVSYFRTWVSGNKEQSTVHNYLLLALVEQGLPGLLLFLLLLFVLLVRMQRLYHRLQDVFYKTVIMCTAVVLCMIIVLNLLSDLVETDKIGSLFYLCCGVLAAVEGLRGFQGASKKELG